MLHNRIGMRGMQRMGMGSGGLPPEFFEQINALFGASIVDYWLLDDPAGTTGAGSVKGQNRHNGTPYNATFGQTGIGDGKTSAYFSGSGFVDVFSAGLASVFPASEGAFLIFGKSTNSTGFKRLVRLYIDNNNFIELLINGTFAGLGSEYKAGGVSVYPGAAVISTAFVSAGIHWKAANTAQVFANGQFGAPAAAGTLTGALTSANIGATNVAPSWVGNLAHAILLNRMLTQADISKVHLYAHPGAITFTTLGDSITEGATSWANLVAASYGAGSNLLINHAKSGAMIMPNAGNDLDTQTTAAAVDNANKIIIAAGTNDNNGGDMAALQAKYAAKITALKASNPGAAIHVINVWPRYDGADKANIRVAIAAAGAAQGAAVHDPTSPAVFDAGDTTDLVHPNTTTGHPKIATWVSGWLSSDNGH